MLIQIITAVFSGLATAFAIEVYRHWKEQKKTLEERRLEHNKQLHDFLEYDETLRQVRPVARLLISTHGEQLPLNKVPKDSQRIKYVEDIKIPIPPVEEILEDEKRAQRLKPPLEYFTIHRTYHRVLFDRRDYAQVWTIRDRIELIGSVTILGWSENCDIVLEPGGTSRLHAVIRYENGKFVLYSMSTSSGILVNNRPVDFQHILQNGEVIEFEGSYLIEFEQKVPALS